MTDRSGVASEIEASGEAVRLEQIFAPGDRVKFRGQCATVISIDAPDVVIQVDHYAASDVVKAGALHRLYEEAAPVEVPSKPEAASLDDLYSKIVAWPEAMQLDNLPMLSKASVMAQIVTAQQLTRIADYLEPRYLPGKDGQAQRLSRFVGNGDDLEAIVIEELNRADVDGLAVKDADLTLARRVAQRMASGK